VISAGAGSLAKAAITALRRRHPEEKFGETQKPTPQSYGMALDTQPDLLLARRLRNANGIRQSGKGVFRFKSGLNTSNSALS
jgi:hypothetical protein